MELAYETLHGDLLLKVKLAWALSSLYYELAEVNCYGHDSAGIEEFKNAKKCNFLSQFYFEKGLSISGDHAAGPDPRSRIAVQKKLANALLC